MTETMIALPVLILFVMCVVQFGLIYRARLTLEYAAHEAARAGSLNNGMPLPFIFRIGNSTVPGLSTLNSAALELTTNALTRGSVWQGLVKGMMPLNVRDASVGGMFKGWIDTNTDLIESACIEYLNPTQTTFIDWAFIENFGENRWIMQIPNDTMRYRKPLPYDFKAKAMSTTVGIGDPLPPDAELRGNVSNKTLGESSVLHLRVHYGYRLGIPVANKIILTALKGYQFVGEAWFKLHVGGRRHRAGHRFPAQPARRLLHRQRQDPAERPTAWWAWSRRCTGTRSIRSAPRATAASTCSGTRRGATMRHQRAGETAGRHDQHLRLRAQQQHRVGLAAAGARRWTRWPTRWATATPSARPSGTPRSRGSWTRCRTRAKRLDARGSARRAWRRTQHRARTQRVAPASLALCASTIFVSAFLLFLVQPLIARQILPWFGGSAAVWTLCLVFFQVVLLVGLLLCRLALAPAAAHAGRRACAAACSRPARCCR
jgi:hypothetical protein